MCAIITAVGGRVPIGLDAIASLMAKFQPIADSLILHRMLTKIAARYVDNSQVVPITDKIEKAFQKLALNAFTRKKTAGQLLDEESAQPSASASASAS